MTCLEVQGIKGDQDHQDVQIDQVDQKDLNKADLEGLHQVDQDVYGHHKVQKSFIREATGPPPW